MRLIDSELYDILTAIAQHAKELDYDAISDDKAFQDAVMRLELYEERQAKAKEKS